MSRVDDAWGHRSDGLSRRNDENELMMAEGSGRYKGTCLLYAGESSRFCSRVVYRLASYM